MPVSGCLVSLVLRFSFQDCGVVEVEVWVRAQTPDTALPGSPRKS